MSRYTTVLADNGNEVAYGFDHAVGPFLDTFDRETDEPISQESYLFTGLDCHALAQRLQGWLDRGLLEDTRELRHHIRRLWLDLPI